MSPPILPISVTNLLRGRGVESERVEFKASWDASSTGPQVLRTICAFANDYHNLNGGYVVIGVAEADGRAVLPPAGISAQHAEAAQRWIRGNCNRLDPPYAPTLSPERVDGRLVLVVWAPASDMRPHRTPARSKGGESKYWIRLGTETVDAGQRGNLLRGLIDQTSRVPWDDRPERIAEVGDMREAKVREFLRDVGSGLLEEPDAREIYRRMRLVVPVNDHEVPRNVGLLFFSNDPAQWFRGAKIEVVHFAADRAGDIQDEYTFGGSLPDQVRSCLAHLRNLCSSHLQKQHDDIHARKWATYPVVALREALMNAVYHRSYDVDQPDPTKVHVFPDRVEIASYPGPVPGIRRAHLLPDAKIRSAAPARNRRIGEFLKELDLAEGHLTGLPKIYAAMSRNGSPPPSFDFDEERTYFQAILPAHPRDVAISAVRDAAHLRAAGNRQDARWRLATALAESRASPDAPALLRELAASRPAGEGNASEPAFLAWGVDGCADGWFYVVLDATGEWCCGVVESLGDILDRAQVGDRVCVDIPIGLPDATNPQPRECDLEARHKLNRDRDGKVLTVPAERRGTSVFPAPARETLEATDYGLASAINYRVTGKRLARQTFAILPKIRDADQLLRGSDKARSIVREVHPELCFWALNGRHPMSCNKRQRTGHDQRLALLARCWPGAEAARDEICRLFLRKQVGRDDIADAMVAAVTGRAKALKTLPAQPTRDAERLPMQMAWAEEDMKVGGVRG